MQPLGYTIAAFFAVFHFPFCSYNFSILLKKVSSWFLVLCSVVQCKHMLWDFPKLVVAAYLTQLVHDLRQNKID